MSSSSSASSLRSQNPQTLQNSASRPKNRRKGVIDLLCPHCGKKFSGDASFSGVQSNYKRHLLTHTNVRPFTCAYCPAGFTTRQNMKRHQRAVHKDLASPSQHVSQPLPSSPATMERAEVPAVVASTTTSTPSVPPPPPQQQQQQLPPPARDAPAPPPFALPSSAHGEKCRYCGRYFAWKSTRALHEKRCRLKKQKSITATREHHQQQHSLRSTDDVDAHGDNEEEKNAIQNSAEDASINGDDDVDGASTAASASPLTPPSLLRKRDLVSQPRPASLARTPLSSSPGLKSRSVPTVVVCEDCELELSSRAKLRRHQFYYCPFRQDVFADPLEDAVEEVECDDERRFVAQMAVESGLKFYENANESDGDSESPRDAANWDHEEEDDYCFFGDASSSDHGDDEDDDDEEEEGDYETEMLAWQAARGQADTQAASSQRTLKKRRRIRKSKRSSATCSNSSDEVIDGEEESEEDEEAKDDEDDGRWMEEQLHLDFKRRRSSNKRKRRILLKRIRAREHLMQHDVLTSMPDGDQSTLRHVAAVTAITTAATRSVSSPPPLAQARGGNTGSAVARISHGIESTLVLEASAALHQRAETLAVPRREQRGMQEANACPFCTASRTFATRKGWMAHALRVHAAEYKAWREKQLLTVAAAESME